MTDYWGSWSLSFVLDYISHKMATSHTAEILKMIIKTTLTEFLWGNEEDTIKNFSSFSGFSPIIILSRNFWVS